MSNPQNPPPVKPNTMEAGQPDKVNSGQTVVIGCKLPNGIIAEVGKQGETHHTVVRINGANAATIVGGYGLTTVSKDFWDAWLASHKQLEFVRKGLVFAHGDQRSAESHAQETSGTKSGFEPINPADVVKDREGRVVLETDMQHMRDGTKAVAEARRAISR